MTVQRAARESGFRQGTSVALCGRLAVALFAASAIVFTFVFSGTLNYFLGINPVGVMAHPYTSQCLLNADGYDCTTLHWQPGIYDELLAVQQAANPTTWADDLSVMWTSKGMPYR